MLAPTGKLRIPTLSPLVCWRHPAEITLARCNKIQGSKHLLLATLDCTLAAVSFTPDLKRHAATVSVSCLYGAQWKKHSRTIEHFQEAMMVMEHVCFATCTSPLPHYDLHVTLCHVLLAERWRCRWSAQPIGTETTEANVTRVICRVDCHVMIRAGESFLMPPSPRTGAFMMFFVSEIENNIVLYTRSYQPFWELLQGSWNKYFIRDWYFFFFFLHCLNSASYWHQNT